MRVLGIETSCDETAAAVLDEGRPVAQAVASQIAQHRRFGGVVPEVASRAHLEQIGPLVDAVLKEAALRPADLDGIAVTRGPGLLGALLVGVSFAKSLAFALERPVVGVNHVLAHVHAAFLAHEPSYPLLALVVSGGHTDLIRFTGPLSAEVVGRSLDDAAGEALDKVARLLGLPYPGGPALERLAEAGDAAKVRLPPVRLGPKRPFDFSFSGLKTAAGRVIEAGGRPRDVAAAFQATVVDHLVRTTGRALLETDRMLVVGGGVAANGRLRKAFAEAFAGRVEVVFPPPALSTDNAAMVARLGWERLRAGERDAPDMVPEPVIHPFRP